MKSNENLYQKNNEVFRSMIKQQRKLETINVILVVLFMISLVVGVLFISDCKCFN